MEKKLSSTDIEKLSKLFAIEVNLIKTVLLIESSGEGFADNGKIKIQFEPHVFARYLTQKNIPHTISSNLSESGKKEFIISSKGVSFANGVDTQTNEWSAYNSACKIDVDSALMATSFGLGQIMGFNFSLAGYKNVKDMVKDFEISEANQLKGMLTFIKNQPRMWRALKNKDWETFAMLYNGVAYKSMKYDIKLASTFNSLEQKNIA